MSENGEKSPTLPENITPIREGIIPEPNQPPQADNPGRRKLLQAITVAALGLTGAVAAGFATNKLVEPKDEKKPEAKLTDQPMRTFSNSSQYAPTPTEADKLASEQYRQRQLEISKNPDDPGSKMEGIQYPKSTATPYPNTPAHKVK